MNEQHLVDALESGKGELYRDFSCCWVLSTVARAALDVFEFEPEIHPKLKENKNVVRRSIPLDKDSSAETDAISSS